MYILIRLVELNARIIWTENQVSIKNEIISIEKVNTKFFYGKFKELSLKNACNMKYWADNFNMPEESFTKFHKLSNSKFISGSVKNVHYTIIHRFLHTRSGQAHMLVENDAFCKHCRLNGVLIRETMYNTLRNRMPQFYHSGMVKLNLVNIIDNNIVFCSVDKIFGMLHVVKEIEILLNMLLHRI